MAPAPAPELDDLELGEEGLDFCISVKSFLIVWYCEEVAEARRALALVSWESVVPLLVAASAIRSRFYRRLEKSYGVLIIGGAGASAGA